MVHLGTKSQSLQEKHEWWPIYRDETGAHAYSPLKAWPFGEWWMPAASTGASTSSGAAYCWLLRVLTTWYRTTSTSRKDITPGRCTDPCMSLRVPSTLVGSQLHVMHLNYLTWFNGASPTGESMMLKRSPARRSKGCLAPPSSCLRALFLIDLVTECSCPSRKMEPKGGFVIWEE